MAQEIYFRKPKFSTGEKALFLLIGSGIGAALGLLLAPKSGQDLREDIVDTTRKGLEKGRQTAVQIGTRAGEYYEVTKDRASEFYDSAADRARQLADNAREVAVTQGNTLSAAIEAGKQAYYEEKRRSEAAIISEGRISYPRELGENLENK